MTVTGRLASVPPGEVTTRSVAAPAVRPSGTVKVMSALPLRVGTPSMRPAVTGKVPTDVSPTKTSTSVLVGESTDVMSRPETVKETSSPSVSSLGWPETATACLRKSGSTLALRSK